MRPSIAATLTLVAALLAAPLAAVVAQEPGAHDEDGPVEMIHRSIDPFRRGVPLTTEPTPAAMPRVLETTARRERGWPEQPPTIPHQIDGYQLDRNSNRCMLCHARSSAEQFDAPMISITHFTDRDGQMLAQLSPRRYFCTACHVVQSDARLLVENAFIDVDSILRQGAALPDGAR